MVDKKQKTTVAYSMRQEGLALGGTLLIVLGLLFLAKELFDADLFYKIWPYAWPLALIALGVIILLRKRR
jgi:uncharacterized integral membrane protein